MEIKGKVVQVLPKEGGTSKSGNQWSRASLIVEVAENPQYPKKIIISNMKNADAFSKIAIGSEVTFKVEIKSREFNGRWYTEVSCWGWDVLQGAQQTAPAQAPTNDSYAAMGMQPTRKGSESQPQEADDLPF